MANGHGGARPGSGAKPTPLNTARVAALYAQGASYAEIGRRFNVGWQVIKRTVKKTNSESKQ